MNGSHQQIAALLGQARGLLERRRFDEALSCIAAALQLEPQQAGLWNEYGALLSDHGRAAEAIAAYDRAIALTPRDPAPHYNRGNALRQMKRYGEAVASYDAALAIDRGMIPAWHNRGSALMSMNDHQAALESFDRILGIHEGTVEAWNSRATALAQLQRSAEALASYDRAVAIQPGFARAWDNRGCLLREMGRPEDALASHERALAIDPRLADAWSNRGNVLRELHRGAEGVASYDRALAIRPDSTVTWINRAIALRDLKRIGEAMTSYDKALTIEPDNGEALYGRGMVAWVEKQDYDAALRDLERVARLNPDFPYALGGLFLVRQYGGDWRDFASLVARINEGVRAGKPVAEPFVYQAISALPADLQACSAIYARHRYPASVSRAFKSPRRGGKIRIGYVSGEFREQATAYLMAGVYECHDKSRFSVTAFDNGGSDHSLMRRRLEASFDEIVDIASLSDMDAAAAIADRDIDILVNLNGYFGDHRMGIFAARPAPIQVNYLGFPATLGASYMDYIIADRIVIPEGEERFYAEQVARLPYSYQANDFFRPPARPRFGRAQCGLPENAFVFCNFNAGYKLTPQNFGLWMAILVQIPGSVLWLLEGGPNFSRNLRREAENRGVTGERLIFAPLVPLEEHLARLELADLLLDSLPCNAHTTASDALRAGVPLVTAKGTAFAGRVAASLLEAIGLPELITETQSAYQSLAVRLARDTQALDGLRRKLARNRLTAPLFDTAGFTKHLEQAYENMLARHERGLPPASFQVRPL